MFGQWKKVKNCGFTLVEMIVVILIIGILTAPAIISFSTVARAKANGCTEKLVKLLDQTRGDSMSRVEGAVKLVVEKKENAYYGTLFINDGTVKDEVKLGDGSLTIRFYLGDFLVSEIDDDSSFTIKYQKGNGALFFDIEAPTFDRIVISGSNTRTIRIYKETGRYRLQ